MLIFSVGLRGTWADRKDISKTVWQVSRNIQIHRQEIRTIEISLFGEHNLQDFEARSPHTCTGSDLDKAPGRAGSSGKADLRGKRNAFTMSRGQFMEEPWNHELAERPQSR